MNEIRKISDFIIQEIRHDLSDKIGFDIRAKADCFRISELILNTTGGKVSGSTLYRMFLHQSKHVPYVYTLDAISEYIGFKNWNEAYHHYQSNELRLLRMGLTISDDINKSLLFQNIVHKAHKPLLGFFDEMHDETYPIKEAVTYSLYDSLQLVSQTKSFFSSFAGHPFVREFFFEIGADPSFRIKDYDFGLKCYLKESKPLEDDLGLRDYVFANCLLFHHYLESNQDKPLLLLGEELFSDFHSMKHRLDSIHPFPKMRYLSLYLSFLNLKGISKRIQLDYASFLLAEAERYANHPDMITRGIAFYQVAESFVKNSIPIDFHNQLKQLFRKDVQRLPEAMFGSSLQKMMPYFQPNGILRNRVYHLN